MTRSPSCRTDEPAETLRQLLSRYPLPPSWRSPELFADVTTVAGVRVHAVGCCSEHPSGDCATGSAASLAGPETARAYFELLERAAIMEAVRRGAEHSVRSQDGTWRGRMGAAEIFPQSPEPEAWRYARSNGVALGTGHADACTRAEWELIERDRILRSWLGETRPVPVSDPLARAALPTALADVYDFRACLFPAGEHDCSAERTAVAGVFGFPRWARAPLVFGFGARAVAADAFVAAGRECIQRLAFLWGEEIPSSDPPFAPTAEFHQEYFLHSRRHEALQGWLSQGSDASARVPPISPSPSGSARRFADLTPASLRGQIAIVKALPRTELLLCFGRAAWPGRDGARAEFHPIP